MTCFGIGTLRRSGNLVRVRAALLITAAFGVVVSSLAGCDRDMAAPTQPTISRIAAVDDRVAGLEDLDGHAVELWPRNKPTAAATVFVFTRSDCPISNRYAPTIRQLYDQYHPRGVEFHLVYVDPNETADAIRRHLAEFRYPCAALRDTRHGLVSLCEVTATPEAVVFDRDHKIAYRGRIDDLYVSVGRSRTAPTRHDLADAIEAMLTGRLVAEPFTEAIGCPIADLKK